mmetsp:Transcript_41062/g.97565  ORF Transcript_41062/g.97565 Transcript_41062/m.97565 type:complete len:523 (-) Transcript_41062:835-2403(-)
MARETSIAATMLVIWPPISTMLAASMAMSVPLPTAIPRSACASAGASLMPSPTIATTWPASWSEETFLALLPGSTSAITQSFEMPRLSAMELAVRWLSPVTIHVEIFIELSLRRTSALSGRGASATARTAATSRSTAARTAVFPSPSRRSTTLCTRSEKPLAFISSIQARVPTAMWRPSTLHWRPLPDSARNPVGVPSRTSPSSRPTPARARRALSSAYATIARPSGCSLFVSAAPTRRTISSSGTLWSKPHTSVTRGLPSVRVPVLSKMTAVTLRACSIASPSFIRTPFLAATPVPTMMAVGTASPMAQGQATTIVAMPMLRANASGVRSPIQSCGTAPSSAARSQPANTAAEVATMAGTNTRLTASAIAWMGGLEACASSIILTIWLRTVSVPVDVTRRNTVPSRTTVAPRILSSTVFTTGMLSPVSMLSSTSAVPTTTTPSAGTDEPRTTLRRSPTWSCSAGISRSLVTCPSSSTVSSVAVCGLSSRSLCSTREVAPLALASSHFPRVMKAMRSAETSK